MFHNIKPYIDTGLVWNTQKIIVFSKFTQIIPGWDGLMERNISYFRRNLQRVNLCLNFFESSSEEVHSTCVQPVSTPGTLLPLMSWCIKWTLDRPLPKSSLCLSLAFDIKSPTPVQLPDPRSTSLVAQLVPDLHPTVSVLKAAKHSSPLPTKEEWTHCLNICQSVILLARPLKETWIFSDISHRRIN